MFESVQGLSAHLAIKTATVSQWKIPNEKNAYILAERYRFMGLEKSKLTCNIGSFADTNTLLPITARKNNCVLNELSTLSRMYGPHRPE